MKLLAFDTSTETLSIAVDPGTGAPVLEHAGAGGPQASAALIPAVQELLARAGLTLGELDAIAFGRGPGSFTGLRTAAGIGEVHLTGPFERHAGRNARDGRFDRVQLELGIAPGTEHHLAVYR